MAESRDIGREYGDTSNNWYTSRSDNESLNTIDNFSLNRIISLCNHSIYRDGRRFAVYRWGVIPQQGKDQGICPEKTKKSRGKLRQKVSTVSKERSESGLLTKKSYQSKK